MGFWDSFQQEFKETLKEENLKTKERQRTSTYQTEKQKKLLHYQELNKKTDSELLRKVKSFSISEEDKEIIESILKKRGYIKKRNGIYDRI